MSPSPYLPLDVIETFGKVNGHQWWVRDAEETFWLLVEYVGNPGRLTCYCDDGVAHAEAPDTEAECIHLRAVIDQRAADRAAKGPKLGVLVPAVFVD